jgi:hypothetical protein
VIIDDAKTAHANALVNPIAQSLFELVHAARLLRNVRPDYVT